MNELDVKKSILKKLKGMLMSEDDMGLGEVLKGKPAKMEKVTVASDSPEGLKKGLSKAQEIMKKRSELMGEEEGEGEIEESPEEEEEELCDEETNVDNEKENLKSKISRLEKLLKK